MGKTPSHSARATFKACKRKALFEVEMRLEPKEQHAGRRMGKAFALALEHADPSKVYESYRISWQELPKVSYAEGEDPMQRIATIRGMEGLDESVRDAWLLEAGKVFVMAEAYLEHYREEAVTEETMSGPRTHLQAKGHYLVRENRFENDTVGNGVLDGVVVVPAGHDGVTYRIGIEDKLLNRNFWRKADEKRLHIDDQVTAYFYAMRTAGTPLTELRYRATLKPSIDQRTSRNPETVEQFLDRLRADIRERPEFYFQEYRLVRSDRDLDEFADGVDDVRREYQRAKRRGAWPRSTDRCSDFGGCTFLDLCRDVQGAMEELRVRPPRLRTAKLSILRTLSSSFAEHSGEGTTTDEVAVAAGVSTPFARRTLRQLERMELVAEVESPGRRLLWTVTDAGHDALDEAS